MLLIFTIIALHTDHFRFALVVVVVERQNIIKRKITSHLFDEY